VKTPPPELVVVDMEPNASVTNVGLRSRAVLRLGAPLWAIRDGQERVGLLAHELGHLAHGDPRRGRVVALAMQTLARWRLALTPPPTTRLDGPLRWTEDVMVTGLRRVVRLWNDVVALLQASAVQRAELRSDRVATRVAGWAGYTGLLEQFRYSERLGRESKWPQHAGMALTSIRVSPEPLTHCLARRTSGLGGSASESRTIATSPTRLCACAYMRPRTSTPEGGLVVPDPARWASIDTELAPVSASLAQRARDDHDATRDPYAGGRAPRYSASALRAAKPGLIVPSMIRSRWSNGQNDDFMALMVSHWSSSQP
jgi:Peptidase family M48